MSRVFRYSVFMVFMLFKISALIIFFWLWKLNLGFQLFGLRLRILGLPEPLIDCPIGSVLTLSRFKDRRLECSLKYRVLECLRHTRKGHIHWGFTSLPPRGDPRSRIGRNIGAGHDRLDVGLLHRMPVFLNILLYILSDLRVHLL